MTNHKNNNINNDQDDDNITDRTDDNSHNDTKDLEHDPLVFSTMEIDNSTEDHTAETEDEVFAGILRVLQELSCLMAHILALLSLLLVVWWIHNLGGLAHVKTWQKEGHDPNLVFNWHPFLMIVAFCFMTIASLSFRSTRIRGNSGNRWIRKLVHVISWILTMACATIALLAVIRSHNMGNGGAGYIANMYSLHSWIGFGVILLFSSQFLGGLFAFTGLKVFSELSKSRLLLIHKHVIGPFIYILTAMTIVSGIIEKETFLGKCSYNVKEPDLHPLWNNLWRINRTCLVSHLLAIFVVSMTFCTLFSLQSFSQQNTTTKNNHIKYR